MTVRAVEERVRDRRPSGKAKEAPAEPARGDAHLRHLETELQRAFGTQVRIHLHGGKRGRIEIPFFGADDFDRVLEMLLGPARD
jgi:hypothetical protein